MFVRSFFLYFFFVFYLTVTGIKDRETDGLPLQLVCAVLTFTVG